MPEKVMLYSCADPESFVRGGPTLIARKPYICVIVQGGGGVRTPCLHPVPLMDPRMQFFFGLLLKERMQYFPYGEHIRSVKISSFPY